MKIALPTMDDPDLKRDINAFLAGCIGVVEANSFEKMCLWKDYTERGKSWVENNEGRFIGVGEFGGMPITLSLWTSVVDGHKIAFWDSPSQVTHNGMIDDWFKEYLPTDAWLPPFDQKRINRTDAMNFHNIFPR